jgi:TonB family protein
MSQIKASEGDMGADLPINLADTKEGLRELLATAISVARQGKNAELDTIVRSLRIPDYMQWFEETEANSESLAEAYRKQVESSNFGVSLKCSLHEYANRTGDVVVRRVNDGPFKPHSFEDSWVNNVLKKPLNIYEATWQDRGIAEGEKGTPIGYFIYTAGSFRWYSITRFGYLDIPRGWKFAQLVEPIYPYPADGQHPGGFVHLKFVILRDGSVSGIKPNGSAVSTTDPKLIRSAIEAVRQWRLIPASTNIPFATQIDDFKVLVSVSETM